MERNEFRAVIKHLHMKSLTPKEIKAELDNIHSTSAPAFSTVYNWVNEFKRGRTSTCDAPRSGRPIEAIMDPCFVHSNESTQKFIWITLKHLQILFGNRHTVALMVHSEQTRHPSIFRRSKRLMVIIAALLDHFNNILKKKRPQLAKKKVLFHQDNARVHTCPALMAKFNEFRYELLSHLAYSPDNLKKWFGGKRFTTREQLIAETEAYFEGLDKSYYSDGLKKLENRWIKCIKLKGDYIEK
ncbi:Histone-lysine N-methyltransferase SETMAR [Trachymyrmex zeteki]|uniref:Histone-lysine N-methyltransferase SETMAR n=1 Tax=Mycetomoellerius zeteki TaxID=64791 RepID=A0A151WQ83_9HYME|nr:Histone-lysine N-methyltransferase SETMAR [Trachymyrmex zeteki]